MLVFQKVFLYVNVVSKTWGVVVNVPNSEFDL